MQSELVCFHKNLKTKHYVSLKKPVYRIGKALDNDIVVLEAETPLYLITLEKKRGRYVWNHQQKQIDAEKNRFYTQEYEFYLRRNQFWFKSAISSFVFAISIVIFSQFHPQAMIHPGNLSLPARGTYGNDDPKNPIEQLAFDFQTTKDRFSVLHYTPGNILGAEDLQIKINGKFVSFVPASPNKWNVEQSIYIHRDRLVDENNKLEFVVKENAQNRWAIKDVYIEEKVEEPIEQNGGELLKNAEKLFRERNVRKGNLIRAQQMARQAGLFYYSKRQAYPENLRSLMEKIMNEKTQMIDEHQMMMQKYKQQGDGKRANRVYRNLMSELIDPMDPDLNKILRQQGSL